MSFKQMFGQVLNFAASTIPITEAYAYKVRKIDNADSRYKDWPVILSADSMRLLHDVKNKQYEAVLTIVRADGKKETFCLFKAQEGSKTLADFVHYHDKLETFYTSCPYSLDINNLQELCTVVREHKEWSVAHIAVAAKIKGCYRVPVIQKELNSQQCDLQQTPLHLAIESGQTEIVHSLLLCGVNVDIPDVNGENAFHAMAKLPTEITAGIIADHIAASSPVKQQLEKEAVGNALNTGLNQTNQEGMLPLHLALQAGNFELAHKFIIHGSRVDLADKLGYPIHYAMKQKQTKIAEAIIEKHQSQGKVKDSKHGGTPLHWAKSTEFLDLILKKQEHDLDATSQSGDTPLHVMVKRLRLECALTLLCAGADANTKGPEGDTALHMAIKKNNLDLVYCMVTFGADVNAPNDKGETPRHLASTQFLSNLSSLVGTSSEMLSVLHLVGAERCEPGMKGCAKGCKAGEEYNGKPPEAMSVTPTETEQLYDDFLALSIATLLTAKTLGMDTIDGGGGGGTDVVDGVAMETDQARLKQERDTDTILALDGGGIRGLILVQLLLAIEKAAGRKIVDMFDWIAGTSTGGILALGLIHGYTVAECKQIYFGLKNAVFFGSRPYSSENFEKYLKEAFGEETLMDAVQYPRVMVTGALCDRNPPGLHLFRNFEPSELSSANVAANTKPFQAPPAPKDQLVWRAARSSGAAPSYFRPLGRFLDGGLVANNPTLDAITEVTEYYMEKKMKGERVKKIGAVVSIGTGDVPLKKITNIDIMRPDNPLDIVNAAMGAASMADIFIEQVKTRSGLRVLLPRTSQKTPHPVRNWLSGPTRYPRCPQYPTRTHNARSSPGKEEIAGPFRLQHPEGTLHTERSSAEQFVDKVVGAANLADIYIEQCTESRGRSVDRARAWCNSIDVPFFRFSPPLSTNMSLDEARDPMLFRMLWETEVYIRQNQKKIQQLADLLTSL